MPVRSVSVSRFLIASLIASSIACAAVLNPTLGRAQIDAPLLGTWVQDDSGPILTSRKRYHFKPDGTYAFVFTSRNTGSLDQKVLAKEEGTFTAEASRLTIAPKTGRARSFPWRIEKDPYVGDIRLVMVLPDGILDVYYRE